MPKLELLCEECGTRFSRFPSHKARTCSRECGKALRRKERQADWAANRLCSLGCGRKTTRIGARLCEPCYGYQRRTGLSGPKPKTKRVGRYVEATGYVSVTVPGHPMATKHGHTREHRVVAYDSHGGRCPNCFWCDALLSWDCAVVDHLNENKSDNRPENLVVACNWCNRARGAVVPFLQRLTDKGFDAFVDAAKELRSPRFGIKTG